jgi:hypothetical protein
MEREPTEAHELAVTRFRAIPNYNFGATHLGIPRSLSCFS